MQVVDRIWFRGVWVLILFIGMTGCSDRPSTDAGASAPLQKFTGRGDKSLPSSNEALEKLIAKGQDPAAKYTVEDFFRNPDKTSFKISPDGTWFSYLGPYENRMNVFVQRIGDTTVLRLTNETDRDIAGYLWANDHRLLYAKDFDGDENFRLYGIDTDGGNLTDLTPYDSVKIKLIDELQENPNEVIIGMNRENKALFEPYKLNVNDGAIVKLASNRNLFNPISSWITDHEGRIRIAEEIVDGVDKVILYRNHDDDPFREVMRLNFKDSFQPIFFDFKHPSVVYAASNIGRDKEAIVRYDLVKQQELEVIYEHPLVDVSSLEYSRLRKCITHVNYTTDKTYRYFFDSLTSGIYTLLESMLRGYEVVITGTDKMEQKYLVRSFSDRSVGAYYLFNLSDSSLTKLIELHPWLKEEDMAEMRPIEYAARDGIKIHGYLTIPSGAREGQLFPVVVNPHGGPWARNKWGYDPEVQLLASRGYAVLQMNYRGSTGYGREFWQLAFKQWGRAMQDDITDGVRWLIEEGVADPDRIAIYGGSYGGYAALAGATFTPDLYTCAIDYVGISNLHTFLDAIPAYWKPYKQMMYEMIGDPEEDSVLMAQASPVHFADRIRIPLLIAQGANDPRVKIRESDQMVQAIRERGIDVAYMVKYDEGHVFRNEENRFDFYYALIGFLEEHMRPRTILQPFK